jgi:hypothetical protein
MAHDTECQENDDVKKHKRKDVSLCCTQCSEYDPRPPDKGRKVTKQFHKEHHIVESTQVNVPLHLK